MIKAEIIEGETKKQLKTNLNNFYLKNTNIKIVNIKYILTNFDDYTAIITYETI